MATAYTVTGNGGEIIALDPADYGPITITGQLTIFGANDAMIAVAAGTTGVTINASAGDRVIIRNVIISGAGATNTKGIELTAGQLTLLNSTLKQLSVAMNVSNTKADVVNTDFIGNVIGINTTGTGTDTQAEPIVYGPTEVRIAWGNAIDNTTAYFMTNPGLGCGGLCNKVTILEFLTSNTSAAFSTNMTGNATLVTGSGSSCTANAGSCTSLGTYLQTQNPR